jgi:hypothetical protein
MPATMRGPTLRQVINAASPAGVSSYDCLVELLPSASRLGVEAGDVLHAFAHAVVVEEVGEDPLRYQLVVLDRPQGPAVIHAMTMRAQYEKYLDRRR